MRYKIKHVGTGRLSATTWRDAATAAAIVAAMHSAREWAVVPLCRWDGGCDAEGDPDLDGFCAGHFDWCERPDVCARQDQSDRRTSDRRTQYVLEDAACPGTYYAGDGVVVTDPRHARAWEYMTFALLHASRMVGAWRAVPVGGVR